MITGKWGSVILLTGLQEAARAEHEVRAGDDLGQMSSFRHSRDYLITSVGSKSYFAREEATERVAINNVIEDHGSQVN
jgi:hypothetical protein